MKRVSIILWLVMALAAVAAAASGIGSKVATIAEGESLSGVVDLGGNVPVVIHLPAVWTAANLTVQACVSSSTASCSDLYDDFGTEVVITAAAARAVRLSPAEFGGLRYIRLRSGTAASAVNQAATRTLVVMVRGL